MKPSTRISRLCLALLLSLALPHRAQAQTQAAAQAQTEPPEAPEPPPAPLRPEPEPNQPLPAANAATVSPERPQPRRKLAETQAERTARFATAAAWSGVAVTLAFVTAGTALGVLAKQRSDDLSRSTTQLIDGRPPVYDAAQQANYLGLQSDGQTYNRAAIACLLVSGVTAVASGLLFWDAAVLHPDDKKLALVPSFSPGSGHLTLSGRF